MPHGWLAAQRRWLRASFLGLRLLPRVLPRPGAAIAAEMQPPPHHPLEEHG
jgi:hypothetical protein